MPQQNLIEALQRHGIPVTDERAGGKWRHSRFYLAASFHGISEAVRLAKEAGIVVRQTPVQEI